MSTTPKPHVGELARVLGPWTATAVVVGTVIGSGVFKNPHDVAKNVESFGPAMLVWVLGGLLAVLGALVLAEAAVLFPRSGGNYVYLREGYGPWAGFLWGWVDFGINRPASIAALATVFAESLHSLLKAGLGREGVFDTSTQLLLTITVILALALVNIWGTRESGYLQLTLTLVKVGTLVAVALLPFAVLAVRGGAGPDLARLSPVWPASAADFSWAGFGVAWMNVAPVAGEVREPQRNLPLALLAGTGLVMALYLSANLAYYLVLPREVMAGLAGETVAARFARELLGPAGAAAVSLAIMFSVSGALNGNLLVGPRVLFALGADGLAPRVLATVHPRHGTPAVAIGVLAGWSCLLVALVPLLQRLPGFKAEDPFSTLIGFVIFGSVTFETLAVTTVFPFRRRFPPGQVPLAYRYWGHPVLPILYVLVMAAVLASMVYDKWLQVLISAAFVGVGALVYAACFAGRPVAAAAPVTVPPG
jgi:amino acid transporter